ncbi:MAG: DEAD/DEAH box helicase, partial [Bdellovibrionaceae bacterium]|nr:DEAD/DEAH box helicase [Pseudobdellovibrionaceae bacterium]
MKSEWASTRLESILEREFEIGSEKILVRGTTSVAALGFALSQAQSKKINDLPHLVVVPSQADCNRLQQSLEAFDPLRQSFVLPASDVSPYSGLYPSPQTIADRVGFLGRALRSRDGDLYIATGVSLSQRTLPKKLFESLSRLLKKDDEIPGDFNSWLEERGYSAAPVVEDRGQYALRGGIVDIWSPAEAKPIRIELFGDQIESLRTFSPNDQRSIDEVRELLLVPAKETLYLEDRYEKLVSAVRADWDRRKVPAHEREDILRSLLQKQAFPGFEFLLPFLYDSTSSALEYFPDGMNLWILDPESIDREIDETFEEWRSDEHASTASVLHPPLEKIWESFNPTFRPTVGRSITFSLIETLQDDSSQVRVVPYRSASTQDLTGLSLSLPFGSDQWFQAIGQKLRTIRDSGERVFIGLRTGPPFERLVLALERMNLTPVRVANDEYLWAQWLSDQDNDPKIVHLVPRTFGESVRIEEERLLLLREDDFFGKKEHRRRSSGAEDFQSQAKRLAFGDLKPGDLVVHVKHGVGQYEGLKLMPIGGIESEFIQVAYKDKDKLYLPVYRVGQLQKYSSSASTTILDKLGGTSWEKTKSKVRSHLRDLASELLELYAKRAEAHRPSFHLNEQDITQFEKGFPYEETEDQLRAIDDIRKDLDSTKPMDRLICGDVGFGKTEVAMRAAFFAIQDRKQVAILAPTTVLTFQHFETFRKRFDGWPIRIQVLNRFVSTADAKKVIAGLKDGSIDIV